MKSFDEALWDHLVEHHGADGAQLRATTPPQTSRRSVVIGIAATGLAAAGVAAVLATGSGGSAHPTTARSGGHDQGVNTAYVVKRVKAEVAREVGQDDTASRSAEYGSGEVSSDGTLTLGPKTYEDADYIASDGVEYDHATWFNTDGSTNFISVTVTDPVVDGKQSFSATYVEQANRTYSQVQTDGPVPGGGRAPADPTPGLGSSPSQVQQALQNGQVAQLGTAMFNGAQAIALSISAPHYRNILYVDPQTYRPVGQAVVGKLGLEVSYWVPATPANITMAEDDSIPAGYRKVGVNEQTLGDFGSATTTGSGPTTTSGTG